jgi:hypothetical protein
MATKIETGCYVDSHHGIYAIQRLCEIAQGFGWTGEVPTDEEAQGSEHYLEQGDEVIDWLNENVAEAGHSFDWYEGNVMYWGEEDWKDVAWW